MNAASRKVQRTYISLTLLATFSSSFIWGINTLFLLDAGLSITEAFAANAFFTLGQVIFEVPTGVVADSWGRRVSYLLGTITLLITTLLYLFMWQVEAPFWAWAISSGLIGLGFTFFSGAVEAWLVDALESTKYKGALEAVFAKGQISGGVAMLSGSLLGGFIAQATNLGVPYILRSVMLFVTFIVALWFMHDMGFKPEKNIKIAKKMGEILKASLTHGLKKPTVRWVMLGSPFAFGIGAFAFYAMQPYLLELYGDPEAYGVAGLAASVIAGAQIVGGLMAAKVRAIFSQRTTAMLFGVVLSAAALAIIGWTDEFYVAVAALVLWASSFAAVGPIRQSYLNKVIPSKQRATILSFDSLLGSAGAVAAQPGLGKVADAWSYSASYLVTAAIQLLAVPVTLMAKRHKDEAADTIEE